MASTITPLLTTLSTADAATGWTLGTADTASQIEGTGCVSAKQAAGLNAIYFTNGAGVDMTTLDRHLYIWGLAAGASTLDTKANGGIRVRIGSNATNYNEWYMDGKDTYTGGWKCFVIDARSDPDLVTGTPNMAAATVFGVTFNCLSAFTGNNKTVFVDATRYGTGLQITATSSSTGFEDIWSNELTNRYGVINKISGVYFLKGELVFGNTASVSNSSFQDSGKTVIFEDQRVTSTLYKVNVVGNAGDTTNAFQFGSAIGSGASTIGSQGVTVAAAGAASSAGTYSFVSGTPATITRASGSFKTDGIKNGMVIKITGTTNNNKTVTVNTVVALTITLITGDTLTTENSVATAVLTATQRFDFKAADANIKNLKLYGSTFKQLDTISLGSSATALSATTVELADNVFTDILKIVKNITTTSPAPLYLRNSANFSFAYTPTYVAASMDLYDVKSVDSAQFQILQGPGFQSSVSGTQSITLTNHNFTVATTPYINLLTNQTWTSVNPNWTITNQTQLNFGGSTLTGAAVNEQFAVNTTVQQPDGTNLQNARVKLTEELPSPAIANQVNTDVNGLGSFNALTRLFAGNTGSALTTTTHSTFALKAYYYGKLPFVGSQTITAAVSPGITLLPDSFQAQATQATAITLGDTTNNVQITDDRATTDCLLILKYTAGVNTLTAGQTIKSSGSGTWRGVVKQIIEGNSTAGTIVVDYLSGVVFSNSAGTLDNSVSSGTWTATYTLSSVKKFKMGVDASTLTAQQLYDYFNAKLADTTLDTAKKFDQVVIWGKSSQAIPIQGSGSKFLTVRNDSTNQQGWVIWNLGGTGLGGIASYMANDGTTFTPAASINVQLTSVVVGSECFIFETGNVSHEIMSPTTAGSSTISVSYTGPSINITIRVRQSSSAPKYQPYEAYGTLTSIDFSLAVSQVLDPIA